MTSILFLCRLIFGMARLVAVTIKNIHGIVKRRLFAPYFGITFTSFTNIGIFLLRFQVSATDDKGHPTADR